MSRDSSNCTTRRRYVSPRNRLRKLLRRKATVKGVLYRLNAEIRFLANRIGDARTLTLVGSVDEPTSELDAGTGPALAAHGADESCDVCGRHDCPSLTSIEQCPELLAAHLNVAADLEGVR